MATINTVSAILASVNTLASCNEEVCFVSLDNTEDFAKFNEILAKSGIMSYVSHNARFDGPNRGFEYYVTNTQQSQISKKLVGLDISLGESKPLHQFLIHLDSDIVAAAIASAPVGLDTAYENTMKDVKCPQFKQSSGYGAQIVHDVRLFGDKHGQKSDFMRKNLARQTALASVCHYVKIKFSGVDTHYVKSECAMTAKKDSFFGYRVKVEGDGFALDVPYMDFLKICDGRMTHVEVFHKGDYALSGNLVNAIACCVPFPYPKHEDTKKTKKNA